MQVYVFIRIFAAFNKYQWMKQRLFHYTDEHFLCSLKLRK
nr:MAG TPA: hypothetical protein [Caudoviricetes sp.]